jgi:hypothetical protein
MDMYGLHMDSVSRAVAGAVAEAIAANGHTQLSVSEATGIPRTTLLRRLGGVTPFTVAELAAIADFLGMAAADFLKEPAA